MFTHQRKVRSLVVIELTSHLVNQAGLEILVKGRYQKSNMVKKIIIIWANSPLLCNESFSFMCPHEKYGEMLPKADLLIYPMFILLIWVLWLFLLVIFHQCLEYVFDHGSESRLLVAWKVII